MRKKDQHRTSVEKEGRRRYQERYGYTCGEYDRLITRVHHHHHQYWRKGRWRWVGYFCVSATAESICLTENFGGGQEEVTFFLLPFLFWSTQMHQQKWRAEKKSIFISLSVFKYSITWRRICIRGLVRQKDSTQRSNIWNPFVSFLSSFRSQVVFPTRFESLARLFSFSLSYNVCRHALMRKEGKIIYADFPSFKNRGGRFIKGNRGKGDEMRRTTHTEIWKKENLKVLLSTRFLSFAVWFSVFFNSPSRA